MGLVLGLGIVFIISCGGAAPAAPTATTVPPTAVPTPVPPTAVPTVAVPTTAAPSSGTTSGGTLLDALTKAKAAQSYRVELQITGQGSFASSAGSTTGGTPTTTPSDAPVTLVVMKGEVSGKDAHFTLQGLMTALMGIDPEKPFEVISYNGQAYMHGPVPLLGATEDKWYQVPSNAASIAQPPLTPGSFLDSFGETGINPNDFKLSGTESLDGKSCQIYSGDKTAVVNAFSKLGGGTGATQEDLDSIESAEFQFWVCDDNYLHQIRMFIAGHDKNQPDQKGSFLIVMKLTDFDTAITIQPPADAVPLQLPTQIAPEITPTPTP